LQNTKKDKKKKVLNR